MFQRSLLRASRQAIVRPSAFAPVTRAATPAIRWYSDAPPAADKAAAPAAEAKDDAATSELAQLKAQAEKKDKEIIDLKVRHPRPPCAHNPR
jgi:molecular chaperone GrpE